MTSKSVFLNNLNGDYYRFSHESREWKPAGNVGMHDKNSMERNNGKTGGVKHEMSIMVRS
jgi:hypothetical protein